MNLCLTLTGGVMGGMYYKDIKYIHTCKKSSSEMELIFFGLMKGVSH